MKSRAKKKGRWVKLLVWLGVSVVALLLFLSWMVSAWIKNYLKSEACRAMIATHIGSNLRAHAEVEPLTWSGSNVFTGRVTLDPLAGQAWNKIEADGVQGAIDWNAAWNGLWKVPSIKIEWLRVNLAAGQAAPSQPVPLIVEAPALPTPTRTWWGRWLPQRTEIEEIEVQNFELNPPQPQGGTAIETMKINARPAVDEGAWLIRSAGGKLLLPHLKEPLRMTTATARFDAKKLSLNDAVAQWFGDSDVTGRGEMSFENGKAWIFSGRINNLELRHVLSEDWKSRMSGVMESSYEVSSAGTGDVLFKGKPRVKNGVVQGMPVLDRVADFTHTERFRRIVLDESVCEFERQGGITKISRIVMQSNGLIRLEGDIVIDGIFLKGQIQIGVSPETLRWMPGAQNHVFTDPHPDGVPGFVWTTVHLDGTVASPKEDLSNRLLAAMGKALLIDAPLDAVGKGVDVLGKTGASLLDPRQGVIENGKEIIKGAGEAAGQGLDILKGVMPLFPK